MAIKPIKTNKKIKQLMKENDITTVQMLHDFMDGDRKPGYTKLSTSFRSNKWDLDTLHHIKKVFRCDYNQIIGDDI